MQHEEVDMMVLKSSVCIGRRGCGRMGKKRYHEAGRQAEAVGHGRRTP